MPILGGARRRPACPTDVSITTACRAAAVALDPARQREAIDVRHLAVGDDDVEGAVVGDAARSAVIADARIADRVGFMCQLASISSRMRRLVALSSTTSTRSPSSALRRVHGRVAGRGLRPVEAAVK